MKLENLRIETADKLVKALATIVWEDSDRPNTDIYFATTEEFSQSLHCDPHAFLVASIMPAVRFKERRIKIDGPICPELIEGLETILTFTRHWYKGERKPVLIEAQELIHRPTIPTAERASFFFSGGVDSLATLRNNRLRFPPSHPSYIRDGFLIYGIESYASNDAYKQLKIFERHIEAINNVAQAANVELIPVYTNVKSLEEDWEFWRNEFQGAVLSAVAHAFSQRINKVSIAGSCNVPYLEPYGSHPLIDPNYSSSSLRIHHDCVALSRLDKVKLISEWPVALNNVKVCYLNPPTQLNCGVCAKCLRTKIALQSIGKLKESKAFVPSDMTEELIAHRAHIVDDEVEACFTEAIRPLTEQGRSDLVRGIRRASNLYRGRGIKGTMMKIDQKLLNGRLRSWNRKRQAKN